MTPPNRPSNEPAREPAQTLASMNKVAVIRQSRGLDVGRRPSARAIPKIAFGPQGRVCRRIATSIALSVTTAASGNAVSRLVEMIATAVAAAKTANAFHRKCRPHDAASLLRSGVEITAPALFGFEVFYPC